MLDRLSPRPGARHRPLRVGRGPGSGRHKTSGRGMKGQGKRSAGRETPAWFEGGQMPLVRRLPKRGFHNPFRKKVQIVNLHTLAPFGDGATIDVDALVARGLVRPGVPVKLLGDGDAPKNLTVRVHRVSRAAREQLEQAGGNVELVT
ncbi:MAG: 50S ribosomal protein L15 [Myxococcota bacterium]